MDFQVSNRLFVVTGATSGFGAAIAATLLEEGASVIINARKPEGLEDMQKKYGSRVEILQGDITTDAVIADLFRLMGSRLVDGMVVNAGGPPAKSFAETQMADWDAAYASILRWKVKITHELLDKMIPQGYGRIVYIESAAVKQPIENLVLSNAMRLAVVGFVKTMSQEIAQHGITANVLAPGYHATPAMERLFANKSMLLGISPDEARQLFEKENLTGKLGNPADLASLALWLLSPHAAFITGQTISVDGGLIKRTMG
ncbi:MAG: SDR family oxidoreductase [Saprospiraceae bacterium]|nr:SDR family oxidoreductase [Saprospiraceae bacterium]